MAIRVVAPFLAAMALLTGCAGRSPDASWGARWPTGGEVADAAMSAARSPTTWAPLLGAAVLSIGDLDEDLSDWAADETPLFGSDADSASDHLRRMARGAWVVSVLAAPSDDLVDKAGGVAVDVAALMLEGAATHAIKETADRRRPDGSNTLSFTSGHAGASSASATLARHNFDYVAMPDWLDVSLSVGLHGVALGSSWARVEARKHHVTDVLAGYALGHFLAAFVHETFMRSPVPPAAVPVAVQFVPVEDGGAITLVFAAR